MKKYIKLLLVGLLLFSFNKIVWAYNDIKSIKMDIYVSKDGTAHIKEEWVADLDKGTEGYKPYYNLGSSKILNFKVSMDGEYFTTLSRWDIDANFKNKSYKAGLNYDSNKVELCFGISDYGKHTYLMEYDITNFVVSLNDAQMIYWQLIPYDLSDKPENIYVKVYSDFPYENTYDVWGYGYGDENDGYAYIYDGYIEITKDSALDSNEYVTLLAKFPEGTFNTNYKIDEDFFYYLDMASEGAINNNVGDEYYEKPSVINIIASIFSNLFFYIILIISISLGIKNYNNFGTRRIKFPKGKMKLKDAPYFRDIPCEKDIFKAYWIAGQYKLIKNKTDFLGAILLKWLKDDVIENVVIPKGKKEEKALKLKDSSSLSEIENELYQMMLKASHDGVLEKHEFESWCEDHYKKILNWFNKVVDGETDKFVEEGLIDKKGNGYYVKDRIQEYAYEMAGLKKFLKEFSNIKERAAIEVKLWEYYLIYAQIFGIAKEVAKEFKEMYPDIITDDYYNDIIFIHTISYNGVHAASLARSRAESYSSGGGGFSSSGGGGGSFGGGGGGGGFR